MFRKHFPGHLNVDYLGDVIVVNFTRRKLLDEPSIQIVSDQLLQLANEVGRGQLLLNFGAVDAMTSFALSQIITVQRKVRAQGGRLLLCNVNPPIDELFEVTQLDDFFNLPAEARARSPGEEDTPLPALEACATEEISWKGHLKRMPIALCEPRPAQAGQLLKVLTRHLNVVRFADLASLTSYIQKHAPAAVAMPLGLPASSGRETEREVLGFLRTHGRQLAIIIYADTGKIPLECYSRALVAGAKRVLDEQAASFPEELRRTLFTLLLQQQTQLKEQQHLDELFTQHGLIGRSPALHQVFQRAVKASQFHDLPVLILGETGTGKQRLAEAIHKMDPQRRTKAFLTVNCSAISKTLAESELFGHAKGAFSGAGSERLGLFRAANGGTLLLDEIGELDIALQPKLLRVLQDRQLLPVGADYEHPIDVRIIAATNQPLAQMVALGKFREDLYQRINVFQIRIPPLRDRPEDIAVQACHFLRMKQPRRAIPVTDFEPRVLQMLQLLPWEGNTRQLQNLIWEVLAHKETGTVVRMEDLPHWVLETVAHSPGCSGQPPTESPPNGAYSGGQSLTEVMEAYERQVLEAALEKHAGNRTRMAAELGLTSRSIFNKIKKYGLG